jgi:hypothetical protein
MGENASPETSYTRLREEVALSDADLAIRDQEVGGSNPVARQVNFLHVSKDVQVLRGLSLS